MVQINKANIGFANMDLDVVFAIFIAVKLPPQG